MQTSGDVIGSDFLTNRESDRGLKQKRLRCLSWPTTSPDLSWGKQAEVQAYECIKADDLPLAGEG